MKKFNAEKNNFWQIYSILNFAKFQLMCMLNNGK